jgi:hypothetical protein
MWKKIVSVAVIALYSCLLLSQDSITSKTLYKKLNNAFGTIATGQGDDVNMVNYGSFDPANGSFKFNFYGPIGSSETKRVPYLSLNAGGKITGDNIGVLFNNSIFNSGVSLGIKIHFNLNPGYFVVMNSDLESVNEKIKLLYNQRNSLDSIARDKYDSSNLSVDLLRTSWELPSLLKSCAQVRDRLRTIDSLLKKTPQTDTAQFLRFTDEDVTLKKELKKLTADSIKLTRHKTDIEYLLKNPFERQNRINKLVNENKESYKANREKAEMSVKLRGRSFLWINTIANVERNKYYTFLGNAPFSKQISKQTITPYSIGFELDFVSFPDTIRTFAGNVSNYHYLNIGITRIHTNNIGDLKTRECLESLAYKSGDSTHVLTEKYNVYTDEVIEYDAWKLYLSYYFSPRTKNSFALHSFTDFEFRNTKQNPLNFGIGVVTGLKNKKGNSAINVEMYIRFIDLFRSLPQEEIRWTRRNEIGLQFGVPLGFNLK